MVIRRMERSRSATSLRRGARGLSSFPNKRILDTMGMNVCTVSKNFVAIKRHWLKSPISSWTYRGIGTGDWIMSICDFWKRAESRKKTAGNFGASKAGLRSTETTSADDEIESGVLLFEYKQVRFFLRDMSLREHEQHVEAYLEQREHRGSSLSHFRFRSLHDAHAYVARRSPISFGFPWFMFLGVVETGVVAVDLAREIYNWVC